MQLELTRDQESLRDTTARYLSNAVPVGQLRKLREHPAGYEEEYWRQGAELGWTSLLVPEGEGGGGVSGKPLVDATLLAFEFGRHAAPGPFLTCNVAAHALSSERSASRTRLLQGLMTGSTVVACCIDGPTSTGSADQPSSLEISVDGDEVILTGVKRPLESAAQAALLLVSGRTGPTTTQVLVPNGAAGLTLEPMHSVDLTRRFWLARFDHVRLPLDAVVGDVGGASDQLARQLQVALVLLASESVGSMQRAFDMTVEWAFDRYSFGRPLASYQELKHRFADMKTWLEASHAVADAAALAVDAGAPEAEELVSVAAAYIGQYGAELAQDCVQLHGGIGLTYEHDLHLFLRRVTLNRALIGTPALHRRRVAALTSRVES